MPSRQTLRDPHIRQVLQEQCLQKVDFAPLAADDNWFKTSATLAAATTELLAASMTKSYAPGHPVVPVLAVTNDWASGESDWTSLSAVFVGVDQFGDTVSETIAATVSSHVWTATANIAFATLISVTFTIVQGSGVAPDANDTYILGYAKTYGIGCKLGATTDVWIHNFDGTTDAGTINANYDTYLIAGTPNAAKILQLWTRSTAP